MVSFVFILRPSFRKILTARLQVHQSRQRLANRLPPACQAFGGNLSLGWSTVVAPRFNSSKLARRMLGGPSLIHRTCKGPRLFLLATCCRTLTLGSDTWRLWSAGLEGGCHPIEISGFSDAMFSNLVLCSLVDLQVLGRPNSVDNSEYLFN